MFLALSQQTFTLDMYKIHSGIKNIELKNLSKNKQTKTFCSTKTQIITGLHLSMTFLNT